MVNRVLADLDQQRYTMSDDEAMTRASNKDGAKKSPGDKEENGNADNLNKNRVLDNTDNLVNMNKHDKGKATPKTDKTTYKENNNNEEKLTNNETERLLGNGCPKLLHTEKKTQFSKQESQASSSATADYNPMIESTVTNDSNVTANATNLSVGGQSAKSAGESTASAQSTQSEAEIMAKGITYICKFNARQVGDKRRCLLRDVTITDNEEVLITDAKNKNVKMFTMEGDYIRTIQHEELKEPFGIAAMSGGRFVVADCKGKDLKIFSVTGTLLQTVGHNLDDYPMKEPTGVAVNSKGEIIVSDAARRCVYVYPLESAFCDIIWGEAGFKPLQFKNPAYVGVTEHDDIIVSDYYSKKIALFDAHTHDLKFTYGTKAKDRKLHYPRGVATDSKGNIIVADNYNGKVQYINGDQGGFIRILYGDRHCIHRPRSVACDIRGNLVVIENGGRVRVFNISGMANTVDQVEEQDA